MGRRRGAPAAERFWHGVQKTDGCWIWGLGKSNGYGKLCVGYVSDGTKKHVSVHRLSWELHYGEIPPGLFVCHRCDTRACVRPDHLFLGTAADNNRDMHNKGRGKCGRGTPRPSARGSKHHNAKLDDVAVVALRSGRARGATYEALGRRFGVCRQTVFKIINSGAWSHT